VRRSLERDISERMAAPEGERRGQPIGCLVGAAFVERALPLGSKTLETLGIELSGMDAQDVPRGLCDQALGIAEHTSKLGHPVVDDLDRGFGRFLAPELVDERVEGHDPVRVQQEHREQGALGRSAKRSVLVPVPDAQGTENPKLHRKSSLRTDAELTLARRLPAGYPRISGFGDYPQA
jgi:hypothetical protein